MIPSDIQALLADAEEFRSKVPGLLDITSRELLDEEINSREVLRIRINEHLSGLSSKIADLENLKRALTICKQYQKSDIERLTSRKWSLINEAKRIPS